MKKVIIFITIIIVFNKKKKVIRKIAKNMQNLKIKI